MSVVNKQEIAELIQNLGMIAEIIQSAEEFKPLIHAAMKALELYKDELKKYPMELAIFKATMTTEVFKKYVENGFSREEAMLLTIDQNLGMKEAWNNIRKQT